MRLSGPQARAIVQPMLRLRHSLAHAKARFAEILETEIPKTEIPKTDIPEAETHHTQIPSSQSPNPATGSPLDEAIVTFFAAPSSYTGEDVIEIACHGSPVLLEHLLRTCIRSGARLAEPGEFTQRAFLSGRLDLTQAEAVNDLIASSTLHQARLAAAQLGGSLARIIAPLKRQLIHLIASLEAGVDFAEDDIDLLPEHEIARQIKAIQQPLGALAATYAYGRIVREGFILAIVGRPNAGKSSLFNRLLERDRAIVTAQPGTTRDPISEPLALGGIPVQLIDTAGLRDAPPGAEGEAELQGILRSRATIAEADLVLHVLDATTSSLPDSLQTDAATNLHPDDASLLASLHGRLHLVVLNKIDLVPTSPESHGSSAAELLVSVHPISITAHPVSAKTGEGIEALKQAILATLSHVPPGADSAVLTNLRQHQAISQATDALAQAHLATIHALPHELLLIDLYATLTALDLLTGATAPDEVLNLIFSTFCIGK